MEEPRQGAVHPVHAQCGRGPADHRQRRSLRLLQLRPARLQRAAELPYPQPQREHPRDLSRWLHPRGGDRRGGLLRPGRRAWRRLAWLGLGPEHGLRPQPHRRLRQQLDKRHLRPGQSHRVLHRRPRLPRLDHQPRPAPARGPVLRSQRAVHRRRIPARELPAGRRRPGGLHPRRQAGAGRPQRR
ncbi:hypothetical protein H1235_15390 [Pseudoxanthomonas sp. NC8]|nr:hypothetical protein H1235_15390 [Pseudoxanthomonas sp. NC8]